jgi:phenylacetate-CoA ligase
VPSVTLTEAADAGEAKGAMQDHYDALETRDPAERERAQLGRLPEAVARAMTAPGWAAHLAGIDPAAATSRAALARLPVLRKPDLLRLQKEHPPFGGFAVTPANKAKRLLMSPGPIFEPEGHGADWWGAARALYAAGFRAGDIAHTCSPAASATLSSRSRRSRISGRAATWARPTS